MMMMESRAWFALTTLCLAVACGPSTPEASTEGGSGSSDTTSDPSATDPTNTTPPDPDTGMTGNLTGDTTAGPDPTTGDPPGPGSCCEVNEAPGCDQPDVLDCVCEIEAACCAFEWDQACVDLAVDDCMATCDDPSTTGDTDTTTGVGNMCEKFYEIEMLPSEATYNGDWQLGMSMVGEGEISVLQGNGTDGSFMYEPDIPCSDTWLMWTRYWEQGNDDSYFATVDGEPMPAAIFEGDCTGGGQGYAWAQLNWRDQGANSCEYLEDPWMLQWDTGLHQVEFSYRESLAMGRVVFTNDPDYVPM